MSKPNSLRASLSTCIRFWHVQRQQGGVQTRQNPVPAPCWIRDWAGGMRLWQLPARSCRRGGTATTGKSRQREAVDPRLTRSTTVPRREYPKPAHSTAS